MATWYERRLVRVCEECMEIQACLKEIEKGGRPPATIVRYLPTMETAAEQVAAELRRLRVALVENQTPQAA